MTARVRTRTKYQTGGSADNVFGGIPRHYTDEDAPVKLLDETMSDVTHYPTYDQPMSLTRLDCRKFRKINGVQNYTVSGIGGRYTANNYAGSAAILSHAYPSNPSITWPKVDGAYAAELIARTSPNRYDVNNLQNLVDLKDTPRLVKLAGDTILKKGAGAYLSWNFGWKPLISDVKKMLDFQSRANKRAKEIHNLYEKGGLHRKRTLDRITKEATATANATLVTGVVMSYKLKDFTTARKWGSIRWKPTTLPPRDESDYRNKALRLVFGAELSPSAVWEAIPWTWLIDWFSDTGDYLVAYNNIVPCSHSDACIMTHIATERTYSRTDNLVLSGGDGSALYETKSRVVTGATLSAGIPFLSAYQLSILGALFISKHRAS